MVVGLYSSSRRSSSRYDTTGRPAPPPGGPPYTSSRWDKYTRTPSGPVYTPDFNARSGNPDPNNYKVLNVETVNGYLLVEIEYLDCKNFEGRKLLMFAKGVTAGDLLMQVAIDPHFGVNDKFIHPIARFIPTPEGMKMAKTLCEALG